MTQTDMTQLISILLQIPGLPETDMAMSDLSSDSHLSLWGYLIKGLLLIVGGVIIRFTTLYFEKKLFASHAAVSGEIREIRKLQKQGHISAAQAEARIQKLIEADSPTQPSAT